MRNTRKCLALRIGVGLAIAESTVAVSATALASTANRSADPVIYNATLTPVNGTGAAGTVTIRLVGASATITEHVTGLAETFDGNPYPHVQHIHINGTGTCPPVTADTSHDGIINTVEGIPFYGSIGTSLTLKGATTPSAGTALSAAPLGAAFDYKRTIELDAPTLASLKAGSADVVVHGIDPNTVSSQQQKEKSELVPSLPLYATSPVLCGFLKVGAAGTPAPTTPMDPAAAMPAKPTYTG